jgi:capsule polysaccharide export protein KpsE/RkpR
MNSEDDMETPVTRRELRGGEASLERTRVDLAEIIAQKLAEQSEWFAQWLSKQEEWLQNKFAQEHDWFARWRAVQEHTLEKRLAAQTVVLKEHANDVLKHHANAIMEHQRSLIGALDDKYSSIPKRTDAVEAAVADLSPRVAVVERKVFAPPTRRTSKRTAARRR